MTPFRAVLLGIGFVLMEAAAPAVPVPAPAPPAPDPRLIESPGEFTLFDGNLTLTATRAENGVRCKIARRKSAGGETATGPAEPMAGPGWFLYAEAVGRVWAFTGTALLLYELEEKADGGGSVRVQDAANAGMSGLVPAAVRAKLPAAVRDQIGK